MQEFNIIEKFFKKLATNTASLNLEDDCAYLENIEKYVVSQDTSIEGIHFFSESTPETIARRSFISSLSDVLSMGCKPTYWMMAISFPKNKHFSSIEWVDKFTETMLNLQNQHGVSLIGGDTTFTNGPLVITITFFGEPYDKIIKRSTAKVEDIVCISNYVGDAYWALQLINNPSKFEFLSEDEKKELLCAYNSPVVNYEVAEQISKYANSCADVSDGLVADFDHIAKASKASIKINIEQLSFSKITSIIINQSECKEEAIIKSITGGDDYILAFTVKQNNLNKLSNYTNIQAIGSVIPSANNKHDTYIYSESRILNSSYKGFIHK